MSIKPLSELSREERASEPPLVPGLPEGPGIRAAMGLTPDMGNVLRKLADILLVNDFPGSTLTRFERELLATGVSAENGCFFCADSHAVHACAVASPNELDASNKLTEEAKAGNTDSYDDKLRALASVAMNVQVLANDHEREANDVEKALEAGATPEDVQLTVAIASAFSMYNRLVEGFRAPTPATLEPYQERAHIVAQNGYSS